ncbi:DUF4747 family protein [Acinetobacter haemolyticus]|uniref:DUF4747 family protein n=1 Tax=Acinetobacter haemolyticus TaxID=29430 RepID=UPI0021CD7B7E|nr:DUF4747 family protein [Acinetobacter haemolyticus]MCU4377233.1 DUF4747 family protein [Acinetobacter haemolyticus]
MGKTKKNKVEKVKFKTYSFVAFNIRLHPHDKPGVYRAFFDFLKSSNLFKKTGYKYNVIGIGEQTYRIFKDNENAFWGHFIRYTEIYDAKWYNTQKEDIEDEDLNELIKVPEHLKLDGTIFDFIFFVDPHVLIVQIDNEDTGTTANTLEKYFKAIFENKEFKKEFTSAEITPITHSEKIKSLLNNPHLKSIEYVIRRPNSDLFSAVIEREVLEDMEESNSDEYRFKMDAQSGKFLNLKDKTKAIGEIAAENGEVNAQILDPELTKYTEISTKKLPIKEPIKLPVDIDKDSKWKFILAKLKPKIRLLSKA